MFSLNRVYLVGHLGSQPTLRVSTRGQSYLNLNLATQKRWKNDNDQWEEKTHWHTVTVWGKEAELCQKHLRKGQAVFIEGHLSPYKIEASVENGTPPRHIQGITADRVRFWRQLAKLETDEIEEVEPYDPPS